MALVRKKLLNLFKKTCDKFTYTENLEELEEKEEQRSELSSTERKAHNSAKLKQNQKLVNLVKTAYDSITEEEGWASLGELGIQLNKLDSSFDSRNYGYKKLGDLIRAIDIFEINAIPHEKNPAVKALYIKVKN
ncbi:MAG: hypothetical protein CLLPBCKN_005905 [Chroococcidiopsis cubana SAG 39.79]|uniref:HTH OST-type domain-containing protein n=1 Tax=Chroococcidiopsis cubana SAG 39.79 TaxID=388085 RepID=A0AB37UBZ9_9CYAN|nr:OST-HTH/LOTUS domain-containing protein [Chroococcidiopsis cubana]MDZ4876485.1 hypothetical protein [Chroococcidiopsis cubana SAG 39.79]RUT05347.1 hypothetical protein DSM107010_55630 [Chroococcidiopsis cubana SAG 39.79]